MTQQYIYVLEGGASNQVKRIIGQYFFLKSDINSLKRQFFYQNWIKTNQQKSIWNLGSDAYFEYTSCYFKVSRFS
jgi:hypothetical protein